jgi:hypothetical protein
MPAGRDIPGNVTRSNFVSCVYNCAFRADSEERSKAGASSAPALLGERDEKAASSRGRHRCGVEFDAERFADDIVDTLAEYKLNFIADALRNVLEILAVARRQ